MIKTEFLMRSATWHNFNVILLNCGMNIQIRKIQDKSSYWHKNNNTSSILTKQSCLLKITWPKRVIPTKSYSLAMLHIHQHLHHLPPCIFSGPLSPIPMYPLLEHGALCFILLSNDVLPSYDVWVDFCCPIGDWWIAMIGLSCMFYYWCCRMVPSVSRKREGFPL